MLKEQRYGWCRVVGRDHGGGYSRRPVTQFALDHRAHLSSLGTRALRDNATLSGTARS